MHASAREDQEREADIRLRDPYESNAHLVGARATAIVWLLVAILVVQIATFLVVYFNPTYTVLHTGD